MTYTAHHRTADLPAVDPALIAQAGENPLRFLAMDALDTALGLIPGIRDPDRLDAWRAVELEHVDPPRDTILDALDDRDRDLRSGPGDRDTAPTASELEAPDESAQEAPDTDSQPTPDPHPDAKLDATEVLIVERATRTEFVFAATAADDDPYVSQTIDEHGELAAASPLTNDDLLSRLDRGPERAHADEITIDPPEAAATEAITA